MTTCAAKQSPSWSSATSWRRSCVHLSLWHNLLRTCSAELHSLTLHKTTPDTKYIMEHITAHQRGYQQFLLCSVVLTELTEIAIIFHNV